MSPLWVIWAKLLVVVLLETPLEIGCVRGYARAIGHTTSVAVELWALRGGINLCIDLNLTNVLIEMDAKIVVDLLLKGEEKTHGNDVLIADCKEGLKKIPKVRIQHCYKETNKCADAFARRGALLSQDFLIFHSTNTNPPPPPPAVDVALLVSLDAVGTMYVWSQAVVSAVS